MSLDKESASLPAAAMKRFADKVAESRGLRIDGGCRNLFSECCSEFIHLLSSEAAEVSKDDGKKTMLPRHVTNAMEKLGLGQFLERIEEEYQSELAQLDKTKKILHDRKMKRDALVDDEELAREQLRLFDLARNTGSDAHR